MLAQSLRRGARTAAAPNLSSALWLQRPDRCPPNSASAPAGGARWAVSYSSTDYDPVPLASEGPKPSVDITRRETLTLFRECLRTAKLFTWNDKDGIPWRDKLVASARKEFEDAKFERDPEIIARLLVVGSESIEKLADRMANKARKVAADEQHLLDPNPARARAVMAEEEKKRTDADNLYWKKDFYQRHSAWEQRNASPGPRAGGGGAAVGDMRSPWSLPSSKTPRS
ncbi:hypothetical protein T484DRAFT_1931361 [Baffinella frigidus]|nr:hypothetical protein T484DRAFT_1931361 [Cryptophyta sp. CCMP2293]